MKVMRDTERKISATPFTSSNCKDEELKAKLYSNRADAYFCLLYGQECFTEN